MSIQLIQKYYAEVEKLIRYGGSRNESSLRRAFINLLEGYASSKNLVLVPEVELLTPAGKRVIPDGTLKDALRQDWGYWESKDEADDIEEEIKKKFGKGYPRDNILFEDTQTAILYQSGQRVMESAFSDAEGLDTVLRLFVGYEPKEVTNFREAIQKFNQDVPALVEELRQIIQEQLDTNPDFKESLDEFLELSRTAINPQVEIADMREMIVQHVLTEDIFMTVFDEPAFHRENNIASKLAEVAAPLFEQAGWRAVHGRIAPYYETINARAAQIYDHHEKQKFLKALYENFYRAYNPKGADRLGIIYTPNEIVRFMIESADHLCYRHFGKGLGDQGVEILDPATGTGTFITEIIEYLPLAQLDYKYEHELHCNEVAILPYYIANLNIEYTYKQKTGQYKEFENICFVDTLDNLGFTRGGGQQMDFFAIMDENAERITRQNTRKISVVIGNPPYNAWQENFNNQNANRAYPGIDQRIKETYIKQGTATLQSSVYDMYTRFYRWASDRLDKNGIVAFITNSSYLDSRAFDGFRKVVTDEFSYIYILDLGGNIRNNPKLSGTTHNVFGIQTGVSIGFLVKSPKKGKTPAQIFYARRHEFETATDKLAFLRSERFSDVRFDSIQPDKRNNWIDITDSDWYELISLIDKKVKSGDKQNAIFSTFSRGLDSHRDDWVYDISEMSLTNKMQFFTDIYEQAISENKYTDKMQIKWDRGLVQYFSRGLRKKFDAHKIVSAIYRPYYKTHLYFDSHFNGMTYQLPNIFPTAESQNMTICFTDAGSAKPFMTLATDKIPDLHLVGAGASTQCLPLYRYAEDGGRVENITDWALKQFQKRYSKSGNRESGNGGRSKSQNTNPEFQITKLDIFHYVYAALHHPAYREKYEINLKREFPRIPFYDDFWQWAEWGKRLMDLHLNYETVEPYVLERVEAPHPDPLPKGEGVAPRARLIARKEKGEIEIDTATTLRGVPAEAWEYQLGTYSALGWILERYKEKKPKDPTIAEKFNTYRFADYKEQVIDLLMRVCTVSVETMKIIDEMPE
jgi:predicted helicase